MSPQFAFMAAQFLNLVWWVVLIRVILSWVVRDPSNPLVRLVGTLTDPWMRPLSRHLTFGGMDLSPIVVMMGISMLRRGLLATAMGA